MLRILTYKILMNFLQMQMDFYSREELEIKGMDIYLIMIIQSICQIIKLIRVSRNYYPISTAIYIKESKN